MVEKIQQSITPEPGVHANFARNQKVVNLKIITGKKEGRIGHSRAKFIENSWPFYINSEKNVTPCYTL